MEMQLSIIGIILSMTFIFLSLNLIFKEKEEERQGVVADDGRQTKKTCSGNCGCQGKCGGGDNCRCKLKRLNELHA